MRSELSTLKCTNELKNIVRKCEREIHIATEKFHNEKQRVIAELERIFIGKKGKARLTGQHLSRIEVIRLTFSPCWNIEFEVVSIKRNGERGNKVWSLLFYQIKEWEDNDGV